MKKTISCMLAFLLAIAMLATPASAADAMYRMMHKDQNVLALGEITELTEKECVVSVKKIIESKAGAPNDWRQLKPETMRFKAKDYRFYNLDDAPKKGDYVLVSANRKKNDRYQIAWGSYRMDSLDVATASIMLPCDASQGIKMNYAAIENFLHSDGENTEFYFDGIKGEVGLYAKGQHDPDAATIIYPKSTDEPLASVPPESVPKN